MFDPVAYINEPRWHEMSLGLERIEELMDRLGNPQKRLRFVHVAGTNGKGSTCAFVSRILQEAGYRTGLFTSPYIVRFEERIRVNGCDISFDDLQRAALAVRDAAEAMASHPTEFELMTAVALLHFAWSECDVVVMEVGLGGRLDSTNVIDTVEVSAITPIALDHCALLGTTLSEIAAEKAGIMKPGVAVVSALQEPEAAASLARHAERVGAPLHFVDAQAIEGTTDAFSYGPCRQVPLALKAGYQRINAALAVEICLALRRRGWRLPDEALERGLSCAVWPGRFEIVAHDPVIVLDGAHNPQGAQAFAEELRTRYDARRIVLVMGVLADKDYGAILTLLVPLAAAFVCMTPPNPRALAAADLAEAVDRACREAQHRLELEPQVAPSIPEALDRARQLAGEDGVVCVCGSLYSLGAVKEALAQRVAAEDARATCA